MATFKKRDTVIATLKNGREVVGTYSKPLNKGEKHIIYVREISGYDLDGAPTYYTERYLVNDDSIRLYKGETTQKKKPYRLWLERANILDRRIKGIEEQIKKNYDGSLLLRLHGSQIFKDENAKAMSMKLSRFIDRFSKVNAKIKEFEDE